MKITVGPMFVLCEGATDLYYILHPVLYDNK